MLKIVALSSPPKFLKDSFFKSLLQNPILFPTISSAFVNSTQRFRNATEQQISSIQNQINNCSADLLVPLCYALLIKIPPHFPLQIFSMVSLKQNIYSIGLMSIENIYSTTVQDWRCAGTIFIPTLCQQLSYTFDDIIALSSLQNCKIM